MMTNETDVEDIGEAEVHAIMELLASYGIGFGGWSDYEVAAYLINQVPELSMYAVRDILPYVGSYMRD